MTSKAGMNLEKILILCHQPIMQENRTSASLKTFSSISDTMTCGGMAGSTYVGQQGIDEDVGWDGPVVGLGALK